MLDLCSMTKPFSDSRNVVVDCVRSMGICSWVVECTRTNWMMLFWRSAVEAGSRDLELKMISTWMRDDKLFTGALLSFAFRVNGYFAPCGTPSNKKFSGGRKSPVNFEVSWKWSGLFLESKASGLGDVRFTSRTPR